MAKRTLSKEHRAAISRGLKRHHASKTKKRSKGYVKGSRSKAKTRKSASRRIDKYSRAKDTAVRKARLATKRLRVIKPLRIKTEGGGYVTVPG